MNASDADAPPLSGGRPTRLLGRRLTLPNGRAMLGAALITAAVVGLFAAHRRAGADAGTPYVVLTRAVTAGAVIEASDVTTRVLDLGDLGSLTVSEPAEAVGSIAAQTLVAGQPLQTANVVAAVDGEGPERPVQVSFAIDRSRALDGALDPGDTVDVVATVGSGTETCTHVVAGAAMVLSVGGSGDEVLTSGRQLTLTIAVDDDQAALGVIFASNEALLNLVRATRPGFGPVTGTYCAGRPRPGLAPASGRSDDVDSGGG